MNRSFRFLALLALVQIFAGCSGPGAVGVNKVTKTGRIVAHSASEAGRSAVVKKKRDLKKKAAPAADENFVPRGGFR